LPWKRFSESGIREHLVPEEREKAARTHFEQAGSIEDKSAEGLEEVLPFLFFMWEQICVLLHVTLLVDFKFFYMKRHELD
jgi:hypothetical protein